MRKQNWQEKIRKFRGLGWRRIVLSVAMLFVILTPLTAGVQPAQAEELSPFQRAALNAGAPGLALLGLVGREVKEKVESRAEEYFDGKVSTVLNSTAAGILFVMSMVLTGLVAMLGKLLGIMVGILQVVAAYGTGGEFGAQTEVIIGWRIVRDTMNSFFIVILIAIAISTIIRFQPFNFRQSLPRLIIAAILINFSRTICLFAINFAASVQFTFISALDDAWGALVIGLRAPAITQFEQESLGALYQGNVGDAISKATDKPVVDHISTIVALLLALFMLVITIAAITFYVIILIVRVVVLWILMILSPLAFFLWGAPGSKSQSYWQEWLGEFVKHVIIGPLLAFFLYLFVLFFVANTSSVYDFQVPINIDSLPRATTTLITKPSLLLGYIISLALLFVGLDITEKLGVRGAKFARKVAEKGVVGGAYKLWTMGNNYLASKGLSVRPIAQVQRIAQGLAARDQANIDSADQVWADRIGRLEKKGPLGGLLAYGAGVLGGRADFFKDNGVLGLNRNSLLGRTGRAVAGVGRLRTAEGRKGLVTSLASAAGTAANVATLGAAGAIAGQSTTLTNLIKGISEYDGVRAQRDSLQASDDLLKASESGELLPFAKLTSKEITQGLSASTNRERLDFLTAKKGRTAKENNELKKLEQLEEYGKIPKDINGVALEDFEKNRESLEKVAQASEGIGKKETLGDFIANKVGAQGRAGQRAKQKGALTGELRKRSAAAGIAGSTARSIQFGRVREEMNKSYPSGQKFELDDLMLDMVGNANSGGKYKFMAAATKAAEQNDFNDAMLGLDPEFTMDAKGFPKIREYMEKQIGMTRPEVDEFLLRIDAISGSNKQTANTSRMKRSEGGARFTTQAEYDANVQKEVLKDVRGHLLGGRGGLGIKEADGKFRMPPAIANGLKLKKKLVMEVLLRKEDRSRMQGRMFEQILSREVGGENAKGNKTAIEWILDGDTSAQANEVRALVKELSKTSSTE